MKSISDEKLLEMLVIHGGVKGASASLGISQNAIYKRLQNEEFRRKYDSLQGIVISTAVTRMTTALEEAIGTLTEIIQDKEANAQTRVSACNSLLTHCNRYIESSNVLRRLDALEELYKKQENE